MKLYRNRWSVTATAFAATALLAAPAQATFPGKNGKIAHSVTQGGEWLVSTVSPDGTGAQQLLGPHDLNAKWSADGKRVVFDTRRGFVNRDIWTANADGTNQQRLTTDPAVDADGSFSRNGQSVIFSRWVGSGNADIYVSSGGTETQVTSTPDWDSQPVYSPNGAKIAFVRVGAGTPLANIWVMNADGSGQTPLTDDVAATDPSWSPDGKQIAFTSTRGGEGVWVMNANGENEHRVSTPDKSGRGPEWSPNGNRIVFSRAGSDGSEPLFTIRASGGDERQLTAPAPGVRHFNPDWQALPKPQQQPKRCVLLVFCG